MIEMIISDGSGDVGLVSINWADKNEHLVPRINAEYGYRPKNNMIYPFGKGIFRAISSAKVIIDSVKEDYAINNSDFTLIFVSNEKTLKKNLAIKSRCAMQDKQAIVIDLYNHDINDIGTLVAFLNEYKVKVLNITGEETLNLFEIKLLKDFLTIMYKLLKKESINYSDYYITKDLS